MQVIVPVKSFRLAKSRLDSAFGSAMRVELARALARNILAELAQSASVTRVAVVTSEPEMAVQCAEFGAEYIWEAGDHGLNGALAVAERALRCADLPTAVVCADLPFFRAAEFDRVAAGHLAAPGERLTLVSDHAGQGTNLRLVTRRGGLPHLYGVNSARAHRAAARARGMHIVQPVSTTLSLDLDTPDQARLIVTHGHAATGGSRRICAVLSSGLSKETQSWLN